VVEKGLGTTGRRHEGSTAADAWARACTASRAVVVGDVGRAEASGLVQGAIRAGYRHLDCACDYGNEAEVGDGIRTAHVPAGMVRVPQLGGDPELVPAARGRRQSQTDFASSDCHGFDVNSKSGISCRPLAVLLKRLSVLNGKPISLRKTKGKRNTLSVN
jgi:hypothetical protein